MSANVRARRRELGMTQQQFADVLGRTLRWVQRLESGRQNITLETLATLAAVLGTGAHTLLVENRVPAPGVGRPPSS
ncbi:MAG: helix-turn-helix transcriptional regulator [Polyangiaceae bacterium]|nr:helix-turn-helix transcriptional regulator [Polyangiaceae bacterium]